MKTTPESFWKNVAITNPGECWLWTRKRQNGYGKVHYQGKVVSAHRLAYFFTHGNLPQNLCVLHKCDNPPCCNPAHLFLGTRQDNVQDAVNKGRNVRGSWVGTAKLTEAQAVEILSSYKPGMGLRLAAACGVTQAAIWQLVNGKSWKHLPRPASLSVGFASGESNGMAVLTEQDVKRIRLLRQRGWTWKQLGTKFGVDLATARRACIGENWGHVDPS